MNMFQKVEAKTVKEYLASLPKERKDMVLYLNNIIEKTSTKFRVYFAHNMLGYGAFPYKNAQKQMVDWPVIALASQKQYVSLYICSIIDGKYLAETYKDQLGHVSVGKSCIRLKRIENIHVPTLKKVLKLAAKYPGLVVEKREKTNRKRSA